MNSKQNCITPTFLH